MVDDLLRDRSITVYRPDPSETDEHVRRLAAQHSAPILTRDRDFVAAHRGGTSHHGILFDPGMHHRAPGEIVAALDSVFDLMDADDIVGTVVRLKRFY